jgi:RNA polymerase sigma-70 factor (ECF subfamily)
MPDFVKASLLFSVSFAMSKNKTDKIQTLFQLKKEKKKIMKTATFAQNLLSMQTELLHFAYKLTADREEANDLLQETSLKALDNEEKYVAETNFKGWIYTIMRNIFINNYRKTLRDQTYVDNTDNQFFLNLGVDIEDDSMQGSYDLKEMRRIVNALPKEYRVPFAMYVSGFKYREIADKLNLPLGTVKSRIYFTRQRLQEDLKDFR